MISSSAISSSAITMIKSPGLPQYGSLMVAGLVLLLSLKEVISSSERWNKYLNNSFNSALIPLLLTFVAIVGYKIMNLI
jgi:hypothetical protein